MRKTCFECRVQDCKWNDIDKNECTKEFATIIMSFNHETKCEDYERCDYEERVRRGTEL